MIEIFDKFKHLIIPSVKNKITYSAAVVNKYGWRIGKDSNGLPLFLIPYDSANSYHKGNITLNNFSVIHNLQCKIIDDGNELHEKFSCILLKGDNEDLIQYFLIIGDSIIRIFDDNPSLKINDIVNRFFKLFEALSKTPKKTIQGIWAEILVIYNSRDPNKLIKCWHNSPSDKFDFAYKSERVEIKSTQRDQRVHSFSIDQLNPQKGIKVLIGSIITKPHPHGKSLNEIIILCRRKLMDVSLIEYLDKVIAETLGDTLENSLKYRFDFDLGLKSIKFFDSNKVPKIEEKDVPPKVFDIKFKASLEGLNEVDLKHLNKQGLFKSL